jgi:phosphate-selective porin
MAHRSRTYLNTLPLALSLVAFAPRLLAAEGVTDPATPPASPTEVPPPAYAEPVAGPGSTTSAPAEEAHGEAASEGHRHHGGGPIAGYADGKFFLRDANDTFLLIPTGRLQVDTYGFAGNGVKDYQRSNGTGLKADMALKRARVELGGRILKRWYFWIGGDFSGGGISGSETQNNGGTATDMFIGYEANKWFRIQVGQFDTPFTMENLTSDKWLTFMERSLTVRTLGAPYNKDLGIMARGESPKGHVSYALAAVSGDGQNRPSPDNRADVMGRFLVRPFAGDDKNPLQRAHVGVSGHWGRRDPNYVRYDAPSLSTPGGYAFWSPTSGSGATLTHVMPSNNQLGGAVELFVPYKRFDLAGEFVYVNEGRREAFDASLNNTERAGTLKGYSYYVQASYWAFGEPRIAGEPAAYPDPKLNPTAGHPSPRPKRALQLAVRWEQMRLNYDSVARSNDDNGVLIPGVKRGAIDAKTQDIKVDALQVAGTYWASKHIRVTAMWSMYRFPTSADEPNQALAPGQKANAKDTGAETLHEFSARVALAL